MSDKKLPALPHVQVPTPTSVPCRPPRPHPRQVPGFLRSGSAQFNRSQSGTDELNGRIKQLTKENDDLRHQIETLHNQALEKDQCIGRLQMEVMQYRRDLDKLHGIVRDLANGIKLVVQEYSDEVKKLQTMKQWPNSDKESIIHVYSHFESDDSS